MASPEPPKTGKSRDVDGFNPGKIVLGLVGAVSLLSFCVLLFFNSNLTAFPLLFFISAAVYGWFKYQPETAKSLSFLTTVVTVVTLGLIAFFLFLEAEDAIGLMGLDLVLPGSEWSPNNNKFSLVPMMWGTLVTTIIAMLIAGPLGIAGALFISEIAPDWAQEIFKPAIEILAGIPSIVYGFIGYTIINSYMMEELSLPYLGSLLVVGVVIGLMALPTVVSVAEDAISAIPESMKSGSLAMGATEWQTIKSVTVPAAFSGISAGVILGVGRAIGETMAATVILGHSQVLPEPLYDVFGNTETLTSLIASQYGPATGTKYQLSALFAAGVVLFVIVMVLSVISRRIEKRMKRKLEGKE